ncbi:peptidoglycan-binding protein [Botryobacter ruber]|uniref:peptidoglycan-binding protein n=1 Tax=Botryobacter ruber TaxID=2171629 RepID=UPI000FEC46F9|nr:peptidoglycan-binding protein [Botryobacter ruber]
MMNEKRPNPPITFKQIAGVALWITLFFPGRFTQAQDICNAYPPPPAPGQWQSEYVNMSSSGTLTYKSDSEGNRIPDFSYAGYHYGEKSLPTVAVVSTIGPVKGDNTAHIQKALDAIGARKPDASGHRGALLLKPGTYEIQGTIQIRHNGVVLRGSGQGTDPATSTILYARGDVPHQRTVVTVGSGKGNPWTTGAAVNITDQFVQVGSLSFHVENPASFSVGQEVIIRHPSDQPWIEAVEGGGVSKDPRWEAGSKDLRWVRKVVKKEGTRLYLNAPVYNHLDRKLTQATVAPVIERSLVSEAGVENLRVDIETAGGEDENHAWSAIGFVGAENCWVQQASARYFGYAGVRTAGAMRITVKHVTATDPVAIRTGGRMYNFSVDGFSQLILFTGCHATKGRHSFVSNGTTTVSGVVFHRCTMEGGDFEAHRHWSQALLLDNLKDVSSANSQAKLINRGDMGSSHGWGAAHSVIWGFNKEIVVQKPPTAQNYVVSTEGTLRNKPFQPGPWGSIEVKKGKLVPESLYEAQLCERLRAAQPVGKASK